MIGGANLIGVIHQLKYSNCRRDDEYIATVGCQATIAGVMATKARLHLAPGHCVCIVRDKAMLTDARDSTGLFGRLCFEDSKSSRLINSLSQFLPLSLIV